MIRQTESTRLTSSFGLPASRGAERDLYIPMPSGSVLSDCAAFKRGKLAHALIDSLAVLWGIVLLCAGIVSIVGPAFLFFFVSFS